VFIFEELPFVKEKPQGCLQRIKNRRAIAHLRLMLMQCSNELIRYYLPDRRYAKYSFCERNSHGTHLIIEPPFFRKCCPDFTTAL